MANTSILAAFERMWQHTVAMLGSKSDIAHTHEITDVDNLQTELDKMAPAYTYSNVDIESGVDSLDTGVMYLVYE